MVRKVLTLVAPAIVLIGDTFYSTRIGLHLVDSSIGTVRLKHRDLGDGAAGRIDVLANEKSKGLDEWTRESCLGSWLGRDARPGQDEGRHGDRCVGWGRLACRGGI